MKSSFIIFFYLYNHYKYGSPLSHLFLPSQGINKAPLPWDGGGECDNSGGSLSWMSEI